jgi:hypothetical protein
MIISPGSWSIVAERLMDGTFKCSGPATKSTLRSVPPPSGCTKARTSPDLRSVARPDKLARIFDGFHYRKGIFVNFVKMLV